MIVTTPLADRFGRVATDLRVSLTDRCNLRCNYCMPAEGLDWLPTEQTLTDDEVVRLITIGVERLGIREVRFTGGEPLLRRGLVDIVGRTHALGVETSLTTNALGLSRTAQALADAGLDRINASIDSVRPETFATITRRDRLKDVVAGLEAAKAAGLGPIKLNAVLLRGTNDDQAAELLHWAVEHRYELRFIEQMPLDAQHDWSRTEMVTADEIYEQLDGRVHPHARTASRAAAPPPSSSTSTAGRRPSASSPRSPARSAATATASGSPPTARSATASSPARSPTSVRRCAPAPSDEEIAERWVIAMLGKRAGHGIDDVTFLQPDRPMSAIGG